MKKLLSIVVLSFFYSTVASADCYDDVEFKWKFGRFRDWGFVTKEEAAMRYDELAIEHGDGYTDSC